MRISQRFGNIVALFDKAIQPICTHAVERASQRKIRNNNNYEFDTCFSPFFLFPFFFRSFSLTRSTCVYARFFFLFSYAFTLLCSLPFYWLPWSFHFIKLILYATNSRSRTTHSKCLCSWSFFLTDSAQVFCKFRFSGSHRAIYFQRHQSSQSGRSTDLSFWFFFSCRPFFDASPARFDCAYFLLSQFFCRTCHLTVEIFHCSTSEPMCANKLLTENRNRFGWQSDSSFLSQLFFSSLLYFRFAWKRISKSISSSRLISAFFFLFICVVSERECHRQLQANCTRKVFSSVRLSLTMSSRWIENRIQWHDDG